MLRFVIAVDGSDPAKRAIEAVAKMAHAGMPVEAVLLNVREPLIIYGDVPVIGIEEIEASQQKAQDRLLSEAEAMALGCGLTVGRSQRAVGVAAAEIVRVAEEQRADQIVLGTHGRGSVGSLFIGSVSQRVVHLSKVPVLLVR